MDATGTLLKEQQLSDTTTKHQNCVQTKLSLIRSISVDNNSVTIARKREISVKECKIVNEPEKKSSSLASRNQPPELFPYCDDVLNSDSNSSPPSLVPEGILARTKVTKSDVTVMEAEMNQTSQFQVIDLGSSPLHDEDEVECIDLDDCSEVEYDDNYVSHMSLKRKADESYKLFDLTPIKQRKFKNDFRAGRVFDDNENSSYSVFLNSNRNKLKLRERDKLRKASERMMRSPKVVTPDIVDLDDEHVEQDEGNVQHVQVEDKDLSIMIVRDGKVTVPTCHKNNATVEHSGSAEKIEKVENNDVCLVSPSNGAGKENVTQTFLTKTFESDVDICSVSTNPSSNLAIGKGERTLSSKSKSLVFKRGNNLSSAFNKENSVLKSSQHVTECIDISGESLDSNCNSSENGEEINKITFNSAIVTGRHISEKIILAASLLLQQTLNETNTTIEVSNESSSFVTHQVHSKNDVNSLPNDSVEDSVKVVEKTKGVTSPGSVCIRDEEKKIENAYGIATKHATHSALNRNSNKQDVICLENESQNNKILSVVDAEDVKIVSQGIKQQLTNLCGINISSVKVGRGNDRDKEECDSIDQAKDVAIVTSVGDNKILCQDKFNKKKISVGEIARPASHHAKGIKKEETLAQKQVAEKAESSMSQLGRSSSESVTSDADISKLKTSKGSVSLAEYHGDESPKSTLGSNDTRIKKCVERDILNISEPTTKPSTETNDSNKMETSSVIEAGSSSGIFSDGLEELNDKNITDLNSNHSAKKGVNSQSGAKMMVDCFGRDLLAGCDIAKRTPSLCSVKDIDSNMYLTLGPSNWHEMEGEDEEDDDYFTLAQQVSTGKEERDIVDGIEFLSFETERDMVEFTKIQYDFCHGSSIDDSMIQSDDGLDMMDDAFALCGDVDLQYMHQAIVPTKTNDITKIKGWRNKQFAVNDNPVHYSGYSNESYEEDDGFESCDVRTADETNMEEDQQNHWYSEDVKHTDAEGDTTGKGDGIHLLDEKSNKVSNFSSSIKQKSSPVKDDVMFSSGAVFRPEAVELLKRLESGINQTKSTKSAFVSDILDNYLSAHSQLNVSYEIPKLGAEEGITHHPERESEQFRLPSPPKVAHVVSEKLPLARKPGPKPKTLAEKRKMLEKEMLETKHTQQQQQPARKRGRPRLHPLVEPAAVPKKNPKLLDNKSKISLTEKPAPRTPEKTHTTVLKQKMYNLDPEYKYTWIGKRPIRITGSKMCNKYSVLHDEQQQLSTEVKQSSPQHSESKLLKSINTESEKQDTTGEKLAAETIEEKNTVKSNSPQNLKLSSSNVNTDSNTSDLSKPHDNRLVVFPGVGCPLHPFAVKHLLQMRRDQVFIDSVWAKFAVSVVTLHGNTNDAPTERHVFPLKCLFSSQKWQSSKLMLHESESFVRENGATLTNSNLGALPQFKTTKTSSESELSKLTPDSVDDSKLVTSLRVSTRCTRLKKANKSLSLVSSRLSSVPFSAPNEVEIEVKKIVEEMLNCFDNHDIQDAVIKDDPDSSSCPSDSSPKSPRKAVIKQKKTKVFRELNRLDVNVIVMKDDENGSPDKVIGNEFCGKDFCRLGCVCNSIENCHNLSVAADRCDKARCIFGCCCSKKESSKNSQSNSNSSGEKPSLLYNTAKRLQDEDNRHLAKVEKEFRHTVVQSKDETIVLGGGSSGDGGRRRREIKLPGRYKDFSVVIGKELALTDFKMISDEDLNNVNHGSRKSERHLYVPNCVEVVTPKPVSTTKPPQKYVRGKLTLEQKISILCERFKVKPCKVHVKKMGGLEDVTPWCMIHLRYDCFCSGQSIKPFKRMSYRPLERPPPVPGPPLDSSVIREQDTEGKPLRLQRRASRNIAVKSTTLNPNVHGHDVDRYSARTKGTTINYVLRNKSHFFKRKHVNIYQQESQTMLNEKETSVMISKPEHEQSECKVPSDGYVVSFDESVPPEASDEQCLMPVISGLEEETGDNEDVGFGKIVSIMSLKPEEFERCETVGETINYADDELQQEAGETCNIDPSTEMPLPQIVNTFSEGVNTQEDSLHSSQFCNLDSDRNQKEKRNQEDIFVKPSMTLIPVLPEGGKDVNSVRLAELISKKDSELRSILENDVVPPILSSSSDIVDCLQLVKWKVLMNSFKNGKYHIWLQYKRGSMPKLLVTETPNKPDQYCMNLHDYHSESPPDFYTKLPLLITFLIGQICTKIPKNDRTLAAIARELSSFGLLQFDGHNWELVGSLVRNFKRYTVRDIHEFCHDPSFQPPQIVNQESNNKLIKSAEVEIYRNEAEEQANEKDRFHLNLQGNIPSNLSNSNLDKHRHDSNDLSVNVDNSLQSQKEKCEKEAVESSESSSLLIDPRKPLGPQLVLAHSMGMIGTDENTIREYSPDKLDQIETDDICILDGESESTISKLLSDDSRTSNNPNDSVIVENEIQKIANINLSNMNHSEEEINSVTALTTEQSEPICEKSDLTFTDVQGHIVDDDSMKKNETGNSSTDNVKTASAKEHSVEQVKDCAKLESAGECPCTSASEKSITLSDNIFDLQENHVSGVEVPLPTGLTPARWYMLNIKDRFDLLHLTHSKCLIRYTQLLRAVLLANTHCKTVRVPLQKKSRDDVHASEPSETGQPKFGVYTVPNLYTRVFIGPYGLREEAGVHALRAENGKLVSAMYLDAANRTNDTDQSLLALMGSDGNEVVLNSRMEQLYDSVAHAPNNSPRLCRGMWLYTARSDKAKSSVVNLNRDKRVLENEENKAESTDQPPAVTCNDSESCNDVQENEACSNQEKIKISDKSDSTAQCSAVNDSVVEVKRIGSRRKQIHQPRDEIPVSPDKDAREILELKEFKKTETSDVKNDAFVVTITNSSSPDSDGEVLDVETPCTTATEFREAQMTLSRNIGRQNSDAEMQRIPIILSTASTASTSSSVPEATSVDSMGVDKSAFKPPSWKHDKKGPRQQQKSPVLCVGKTAVSIKLVPSISSLGYVTGEMYHNKTVLLKNPFSNVNHQAYFRNLDTATKWLTDELRKNLKFVPQDLPIVWRVKHGTVNIKNCWPFNSNILDGHYVLTESGVIDSTGNPIKLTDQILENSSNKCKLKTALDHANNEKMRRQEIYECFQKLGSTFLSSNALRKTNKYNILKMAVNEIRKIHITNNNLQTDLSMLRKRRITNFARFYQKLKALPSIEDRKREMANLRAIFQNYGDKIPVIDLEDTDEGSDKQYSNSQMSLLRTSTDSSSDKQYAPRSDESDADDYLTDEKESEVESTKSYGKEERNSDKKKSNSKEEMNIVNEEKITTSGPIRPSEKKDVLPFPVRVGREMCCISLLKQKEDRSEKQPNVNHQLKFKDEEEKNVPLPFRLKDDGDDSVSVSISVVRDDEPTAIVRDSDDKDVVTVTRIPQFDRSKENSHQEPFVSNITKSNISCSGLQITGIPDGLQIIPLTNSDPVLKVHDMSKPEDFLGFPSSPDGTVESSEGCKGFLGFPNSQEKNKPEPNEKKVPFHSSNVKDGSFNESNQPDKQTGEEGVIPTLSGVCYTVTPSQRERLSISVDSEQIKTNSMLNFQTVKSFQNASSMLQNFKTFKLQQFLGASAPTNYIAPSTETSVDGPPPAKIRLIDLNQKKAVNISNLAEKDIEKQIPNSGLPPLVSISNGPNLVGTSTVSLPSLNRNNLLLRNSDLKFVLYDNSKGRLITTPVKADNKIASPIQILAANKISNPVNPQAGNKTGYIPIQMQTENKTGHTPVQMQVGNKTGYTPVQMQVGNKFPNSSIQLQTRNENTSPPIRLQMENKIESPSASPTNEKPSPPTQIRSENEISYPAVVTQTENKMSSPSAQVQSGYKIGNAPMQFQSGNRMGYHVVTNNHIEKSSVLKPSVNQKPTSPLYVTIVGSKETMSAADFMRKLRTHSIHQARKLLPKPSPKVSKTVNRSQALQLIKSVGARTLSITGNKLVNVPTNSSKNIQCLLSNGKQLYSPGQARVPVVTTGDSPFTTNSNSSRPLTTAVIKPLQSSEIGMNSGKQLLEPGRGPISIFPSDDSGRDNHPLTAVIEPMQSSELGTTSGKQLFEPGQGPISIFPSDDSGRGKCPATAVIKPLQPSGLTTISVPQTIKLKKVPASSVPEEMRRMSYETFVGSKCTSSSKLMLTTVPTVSNSVTSPSLKPGVVNTCDYEPAPSIWNSKKFNRTSVSPTFIPIARKISPAQLEQMRKNSNIYFKAFSSSLPFTNAGTAISSDMKSVTANEIKVINSSSLNLNTSLPASNVPLMTKAAKSKSVSSVPCASSDPSIVKGIQSGQSRGKKKISKSDKESGECKVPQRASASSDRLSDRRVRNKYELPRLRQISKRASKLKAQAVQTAAKSSWAVKSGGHKTKMVTRSSTRRKEMLKRMKYY